MPFVPTLSLLAALKAALLEIPHPGTEQAAAGEKLFEAVIFHENKRLAEALRDLVVVKQRVAVIVPGGDSYVNTKEGRTVRSERFSSLDLLIADRAWTQGGHAAVFSGENNIGVLRMKDLVVAHLVARCQLGLPEVILQPTEGAHITLADEQVKDSPGRECFVLGYETPAGWETLTPTAPRPAPISP